MGLSKVASGIAFGKRNLQDVMGDGLSKRKLLEEVLCRSVHVRSVTGAFYMGIRMNLNRPLERSRQLVL